MTDYQQKSLRAEDEQAPMNHNNEQHATVPPGIEFELPPMPESEAYLYVNGDHRGVSLHYRSDMGISEGTVRKSLITTEQAAEWAREVIRRYCALLEQEKRSSS